MSNTTYKRVLLKLSGETLLGSAPFGIHHEAVKNTSQKIYELASSGVQVGIVIGGGNIFRGLQQGNSFGMQRVKADQIGMLATLMNGITLQQALQQLGIETHVMSALECPKVAENYHWEKAMEYLSKNAVVIFVGGTGNPYFTTDTSAALRASEIQAEIFLKATTKVDGIYSKDPLLHKDAIRYERITYAQFLTEKLRILDYTAVALCMANQIPIRVFNFYAGNLMSAVSDQSFGTIVE